MFPSISNLVNINPVVGAVDTNLYEYFKVVPLFLVLYLG
jgi:hypothetical protein